MNEPRKTIHLPKLVARAPSRGEGVVDELGVAFEPDARRRPIVTGRPAVIAADVRDPAEPPDDAFDDGPDDDGPDGDEADDDEAASAGAQNEDRRAIAALAAAAAAPVRAPAAPAATVAPRPGAEAPAPAAVPARGHGEPAAAPRTAAADPPRARWNVYRELALEVCALLLAASIAAAIAMGLVLYALSIGGRGTAPAQPGPASGPAGPETRAEAGERGAQRRIDAAAGQFAWPGRTRLAQRPPAQTGTVAAGAWLTADR